MITLIEVHFKATLTLNLQFVYRSLSITDRVVKMMEKYSEDLENKVALKTQELQNQQSDKKLCCRYLPQ